MEDRVEKLAKKLGSRYRWVRAYAAKDLGKIGDPTAVGPLIAALRDKSENVRKKAAEALAKIDPNWPKSEAAEKQVPEFTAALRDGDRGIRKEAADALGQIRIPGP